MATKAASGVEDPVRQQARALITSLVSSSFSATLKNESDIVNTFMALIYFESRFQVSALGGLLGSLGTASKDFLNASAISSVINGTDPVARSNVLSANRALGLCQVLGCYFIKNSSAKSGKNLIEAARPDLAGALVSVAGTDVISTVTGTANMQKAITAGLIVLESKYKAVYQSGSGWKVNGDRNNHTFTSKLGAAVGAYLGLGTSDQNGTTPEAYSASIVGGQAYQIANDPNTIIGQHTSQTGGQVANTDGSGQTPITPAGC